MSLESILLFPTSLTCALEAGTVCNEGGHTIRAVRWVGKRKELCSKQQASHTNDRTPPMDILEVQRLLSDHIGQDKIRSCTSWILRARKVTLAHCSNFFVKEISSYLKWDLILCVRMYVSSDDYQLAHFIIIYYMIILLLWYMIW